MSRVRSYIFLFAMIYCTTQSCFPFYPAQRRKKVGEPVLYILKCTTLSASSFSIFFFGKIDQRSSISRAERTVDVVKHTNQINIAFDYLRMGIVNTLC